MTRTQLTLFFKYLDANVDIEAFKDIYTTNVHFKDPFHDVYGLDAVYQIFQQMYKRLDAPKFELNEFVQEGNVAYVKWRFLFKFKGEESLQDFEGVSRLVIDADGRISEHIDFWDAAEHIYEKLPLLGMLIRWVRQKIQKG